eukprot:3722931-Pleurochrysis_carterae.AAC.1
MRPGVVARSGVGLELYERALQGRRWQLLNKKPVRSERSEWNLEHESRAVKSSGDSCGLP